MASASRYNKGTQRYGSMQMYTMESKAYSWRLVCIFVAFFGQCGGML
jgi:hypothetical protein